MPTHDVKPLLLIVGDPTDGFSFYGPLEDGDQVDAEARELRNKTWWLVGLHDLPHEWSTDERPACASPLVTVTRSALREAIACASRALEGDSNDAEHDALSTLHETLTSWTANPPGAAAELVGKLTQPSPADEAPGDYKTSAKVDITRIYRFEAAHYLPNWEGPAGRLHGHSYTVEATTAAGVPTEDTDRLWKHAVEPLVEHQHLNDHFDDTTVEGLAVALLNLLPEATAVSVQEGQLRRALARR
jgi:6-pyruvoyl tetrahydropterin synthase